MVLTRRMTSSIENDSVSMAELSESVKEYLDGLFKAQADTFKKENTRLRTTIEARNKQLVELQNTVADLNNKFAKLQETIDSKDTRIKELEVGLVSVVQHNVKLASDIATTRESLDVRVDDLEQHGRKMCLRIEGIEVSDDETNEDLADKMESALASLRADVSRADFVRWHRSGRPRTTDDGRRVAQTIVRFKSWSARSRVYETRFAGTREQRKLRPHFARQDLTKRRLHLLGEAQTALKLHPTTHADANADCRLFLINRVTKAKTFFNTTDELKSALFSVSS